MIFYIITDDILKMVVKNNEMADSKLQLAKEYAFGLIVDTDLNDELDKSFNQQSISELYFIDSNITKIIQKYFLYSKDVYSVNIITDKYVFGTNTNKNYYPTGVFKDTLMFDMAVKNAPLFTWIPTYKYSEMFKQDYLDYVNIEYKYMFSAAKVLNYEEGRNTARDYSILVLNFTESFFDGIFLNNSKYGDMGYFIVTGDGNIVAHNDKSKLCDRIDYPWLSTAFANNTGYSIVSIDGEEYLICYNKSKVTGWLSVATVKTKSIMKAYYNEIWYITIIILAIILLSLLLFSIFITRSFINPIIMVTNAIDKTSEYNFDLVLEEKGGKELKNLIKTFNNMNRKIKSLIRENYEMLILKQQSQLQTINLQLNPHFLYNILNTVNLELIKNKQYSSSEMINDLSQMVKYLLSSDNFLENFKTDLEYTTRYINIINRRYKNKYEIVFDIDPELYKYKVPKFFLQPIIENVFVHAFEGIRRKGILKVTCKIVDNKRVFIVEDNGKGIPSEQLALLNSDLNKSIGISNVRNRIRFIYGEQYSLKIDSEIDVGTTVTITLPMP